MAYSLSVEIKKSQYMNLPIDKLQDKGLFYKLSTFKKPGLCSLEEIDLFTTQFHNELELRKVLLENGILPVNLSNKNITIRYKSEGEFKKVMYDLFYQKDIENIVEPKKIIESIYERFKKGEYDLILKLFIHFQKHRDCSSTASEIIYYIEDTVRKNTINGHLFEKDENNDEIIVRGLKLLIYEYRQKFGKIYYQNKIKYRYLHDIIAFVNNYDKQEEKEEKNDNFEQYDLFTVPEEEQSASAIRNSKVHDIEEPKNTVEEQEEEIEPDKFVFQDEAKFGLDEIERRINMEMIERQTLSSTPKKRVRKIIPNQISLFDNEEK